PGRAGRTTGRTGRAPSVGPGGRAGRCRSEPARRSSSRSVAQRVADRPVAAAAQDLHRRRTGHRGHVSGGQARPGGPRRAGRRPTHRSGVGRAARGGAGRRRRPAHLLDRALSGRSGVRRFTARVGDLAPPASVRRPGARRTAGLPAGTHAGIRAAGRGDRGGERHRRSAAAVAGSDEDGAPDFRSARRSGDRIARRTGRTSRRRHDPRGRGGSRTGRGGHVSFVESEERQALRAAAFELASKYGHEYTLKQARSGGKTDEMWAEAGKLGYLGVAVPEEYGGGGGGIGDLAAVLEEFCAAGVPQLLMVVSPAICATVIARYGTEEQKQRWLPRFAT